MNESSNDALKKLLMKTPSKKVLVDVELTDREKNVFMDRLRKYYERGGFWFDKNKNPMTPRCPAKNKCDSSKPLVKGLIPESLVNFVNEVAPNHPNAQRYLMRVAGALVCKYCNEVFCTSFDSACCPFIRLDKEEINGALRKMFQ